MKRNKLISVVIPMYNVEKYIEKCLLSVKNQSYTNFEVLIVNDGTKDKSREVADNTIKGDLRFRILDKENGGLSSARNYGMKNAKGDYLIFIDGDDYVGKDYLLNLYTALQNNSDCDIAMSRIIYVNEDDNFIEKVSKHKEKIVSSNVAIKKMMLRDKYHHCAYGKMYKIELWDTIKFPEGRIYEDYLTTYKLFSGSSNVALVDSRDYFYVQHEGSIMHDKLSDKTLDIINVSDEVTEWIYNNNKDVYMPALELKIATYIKILQKIKNSNSDDYNEQDYKISKFIRENGWSILMYIGTPIKDKIKIFMYMLNRKLFFKFYNFASREK